MDSDSPTPKTLVYNITSLCNNNCLFCYYDKEHGNVPYGKISSDLQKEFSAGARKLVLTGGEPTLHPDIIKIIRFSKELGFENITLMTNGRMLSYPDFAGGLAEAGLTEIVFSIHGHTARLHDSITQSAGSFSQLVKGIENALGTGLSLGFSITIIKTNCPYLTDILKLLFGLGADNITFLALKPFGHSLDHKDLIPSYTQIRGPVISALDFAKENGKHVYIQDYPLCLLGAHVSYAREHERADMAIISQFDRDAKATTDRFERGEKKIFLPTCRECPQKRLCGGVWKNYIDLFGDMDFGPSNP